MKSITISVNSGTLLYLAFLAAASLMTKLGASGADPDRESLFMFPDWGSDVRVPQPMAGGGSNSKYSISPWHVDHDQKGARFTYSIASTRVFKVTANNSFWTAVSVGVGSPNLYVGDVFPLNGWICRVHNLGSGIEVERIDGKVRSRGVEVFPAGDAYVIPYQGATQLFLLRNCAMRLQEFIEVDEQTGDWRAKIEISRSVGPPTDGRNVSIILDVRVGTFFQIGTQRFVVTSIVPPDEKQRIIGWIVFDHAPRTISLLNTTKVMKATEGADPASDYAISPNQVQIDDRGRYLVVAVYGDRRELGGGIGFAIQSHEIREGDIFPLNGWICKASIGDGDEKAEVLDKSSNARLLPIEPPLEKFALSLGKTAWMKIDVGCRVRLESIRWDKDGKIPLEARIDIGTLTGVPKEPTKSQEVHTFVDARIGSRFKARKQEFIVTAIVPPDEEHQVIGWIVFDHAPREEKQK